MAKVAGDDVQSIISQVFQDDSGRMIATLIRTLHDFDLAEESLQDAVEVALQRWPDEGTPVNPAGWLVTVARRRALDRLRRDKNQQHKYRLLAADPAVGLHSGQDQPEEIAIACYRESFELQWSRRDAANLAEFLVNFATLLMEEGHLERSVRLFGAVETALAVSSYHIYGQRFHNHDLAQERLRNELGVERFNGLKAAGSAMDHDQIIAELEVALATNLDSADRKSAEVDLMAEESFGLTRRELEILQLLAEGMSSQLIADRLHISVHTVKRHVNNILAKLDVSSRASAVAFAYQHQLV